MFIYTLLFFINEFGHYVPFIQAWWGVDIWGPPIIIQMPIIPSTPPQPTDQDCGEEVLVLIELGPKC